MKARPNIARVAQGIGLKRGFWVVRTSPLNDVKALVEALKVVPSPSPLIRIGPMLDGGYLVPDDLEGIGAVISPGVANEVGFDLDMAERGVAVHMADASVAGPPIEHDNFHFRPLFLDTFNSDTTITLDDFVGDVAPGQDLLLEMDIEGAEWRVFSAASVETLSRFRIMVVEFHDLSDIFSRFGLREIGAVFRKLLRTHAVVHIHPNNITAAVEVDGVTVPPLMEFTFYRRDRGLFERGPSSFPHDLDAPCCSDRPDYPLPRTWYDR